MTRALAAADRTRPAPGDLPDFDDDARHRRWIMARFLGVDPRFCNVIDRIAPNTDLGEVVLAVFEAHRTAERVMAALTGGHRARAAAAVARQRKVLDLAIELLRPVDVDCEDALAEEIIDEIVGAFRGIAAPALGLDRRRLLAALIAERERYAQAAKFLDGRGRPPSRLRAFADQLLPVFARHARAECRDRPDFRDFLLEASRLVTGAEPGSALANRVTRDVLK